MKLKGYMNSVPRGDRVWHRGFECDHLGFFLGNVLIAASTFLVFTAVICVSSGKAETAREYIGPTCSEISAKFSPGTEISDIQMNEFLQDYKGKWVKWAGTIAGVSETLWGVEVGIKCTQGVRTADATISFDSSWKPSLMQLKGGQQIQFAGQLEGYGELGGILIKEGELSSNGESVAHLGSASVLSSGQSGAARSQLSRSGELESLPQTFSETVRSKTFRGAWFTILYPGDFTVLPSKPSSPLPGEDKAYDSAFFASGDRIVHFYVFSPRFDGSPDDVEINSALEEYVALETEERGSKKIRRFTVKAKDQSYLRSIEDTIDTKTRRRRVFGIKYRDQRAYDSYRPVYLEFKKSLVQY